jgi:hypothetical protein
MLLAATAGVEAGIVLHGAVDSLVGGMKRTPANVRGLGEEWVPEEGEGEGADGDGNAGEVEGEGQGEEWEDEQRVTIRLFDQYVFCLSLLY